MDMLLQEVRNLEIMRNDSSGLHLEKMFADALAEALCQRYGNGNNRAEFYSYIDWVTRVVRIPLTQFGFTTEVMAKLHHQSVNDYFKKHYGLAMDRGAVVLQFR